MNPESWKRVLVLQTSFIGDTVLTLPLISEIKRRFAPAHLALLCTPSGGELLSGHPAIDEILIDDKRSADRGWSGLRRKADLLKKKSFTAAVTPHKSLRSALLLWLAAIPFRVGFRQSKGAFLFHARASRDAARHDVERNLSLLKACGVAPQDCRRSLDLPVDDALERSARTKLQALGFDPARPAFGFNPGSVWPMKRWSTDGFARVIECVCDAYDCQIILFGGPQDLQIVRAVEQRSGAKAINAAGQLTLGELPAAIGFCKLFVTNDSGPMHVAVARGVPTVAIFCATAPSQGFYPYSSDAIVVEKNLHCRPCSAHGGRRCPLGTEECIRGIEPQAVFAAVRKLMDRNTAGALQTFTPQRASV
jgi:heptosyltransferase-2